MKRGTPTHLKTKRLAKALGVPRLVAVGLLEGLWHVTIAHAIQGDLGKRCTDDEIEEETGWSELAALFPNAPKLVPTLVAQGFLDEDPVHRLLVHDWPDHADQSVQKTLKNRGLEFARPATRINPDGGGNDSGNIPPERVEVGEPIRGKATATVEALSSVTESAPTVLAGRDRPRVAGAKPPPLELGEKAPGVPCAAFQEAAFQRYPELYRRNVWLAAGACVWEDVTDGVIAVKFLEKLLPLRDRGEPLVAAMQAFRRYLQDKKPEGPRSYGVDDFVTRYGHYVRRPKQVRAETDPVAAIPDAKPERTPEAREAVRASVAALPFMRAYVGRA